MNKTVALVLLLCGIFLFLGSCVPWGYAAYRALLAEPGTSVLVAPGAVQITQAIPVAPGKAARIAVRGHVSTSSVQEEHKDTSAGETEYVARYRFPVVLDVWDDSGNSLLHRTTVIAWDSGTRSTTDKSVSSTGGELTVRTYFSRFTAPRSGRIRARLVIGADDRYRASLSDASIEVFDDLFNATPYVLGGITAFVAGLILAFIGFVYLLARTVPAAAGAPHADSTGSESTRQHASLCHLSGLLGYVVPFGSIIGPLVLWLTWRDDDPYVLEQGREAVNFQISILIYALLSILLMLVLVGFLLILAVVIFQLVMTIQAGVRASSGENFRYPLTIRFIADGSARL